MIIDILFAGKSGGSNVADNMPHCFQSVQISWVSCCLITPPTSMGQKIKSVSGFFQTSHKTFTLKELEQ